MEINPTTDEYLASQTAMQIEVEKLRMQFPDTQTLYREVCALMFFRYGVTPTSNKLYQLVRKGSMSAPAEALNRFWHTLREKSKVRVEHVDLPESLQDTAGQLIAELWKKSQLEAQNLQDAFRSECEMAVQQACQQTDVGLIEIGMLKGTLQQQHSMLEAQTQQTHVAQMAIVVAQEEIGALQTKLRTQTAEQTQQMQELQKNIHESHQKHRLEMENWQQQTATTQQQYAEDARRLLLDIDRERLATAKLQKSLDHSQRLQAEQSALHRSSLETLNHQLSQSQDTIQLTARKSANLEGMVAELRQQLQALQQISKAQRQKIAMPTVSSRPAVRPARAAASRSVRMPQVLQKNRSIRTLEA